jgi:homoserine dehydrogenase
MPVATLVTVIGPGLVGSALLRQLHAHGARHGVRVVGVANSKRMMLLPLDAGSDAAGSTLSAASLDDGGAAVAADFAALTAHMAAGAAALGAVPVVCDCTSSTAVAAAYPAMLAAGVSVCTPNKKAFSGDESLFAEVTRDAAAGERRGLCRHEATVGAGLPVLSSLADLIATGDKIVKVQGVLSGTISYLLNSFSPSAGRYVLRDFRRKIPAIDRFFFFWFLVFFLQIQFLSPPQKKKKKKKPNNYTPLQHNTHTCLPQLHQELV